MIIRKKESERKKTVIPFLVFPFQFIQFNASYALIPFLDFKRIEMIRSSAYKSDENLRIWNAIENVIELRTISYA